MAQVDKGTSSGSTPVEKQTQQTSKEKPVLLEEVLVTAQKRPERLQDVPISISVLSGSDLEHAGVQGVTEALNRVPGVSANVTRQSGGTQLSVRGVTAGGPLFNGSSPIAYYLDSVPFGLIKDAIAPDSSAYDLDRVEVLRGPQGTLYGASAENGVVRVLTKDASLDAFELKARTSLSRTEGGGRSYGGDAAINVPIIDRKLAARAVVGYENLGGWIDKATEKDANDGQLRNYRVKVNARPSDEFSIGLSAWSSRDDYGAPSIGTKDQKSLSPLSEHVSIDYDSYGLKLGYQFPLFSVLSMTSYLDYANDSALDLTPFGLANRLVTTLHSRVVSEELVLNSSTAGPWGWSAGAFYRDARDRFMQVIAQLTSPTNYVDASKSSAAFGEVGRRFNEGKMELAVGLRHFHDKVSNDDVTPLSVPYHPRDSFNSTTPRVFLSWFPNKDVTFYVSYSEGFRSGFPQNADVASANIAPLKPDKLHNYEIGAKWSLLDRRVFVDSSLYYINWHDVQQQLNVIVPSIPVPVTAMVNGQAASGAGVDFALTVLPVDGLELGVNLGWNDLKMDAPVFSGGVLFFDKGDRLNNSPELTAGASASYDFPLGSGGVRGRFSTSANYTSKQTLRNMLGSTRIVADGDSMLIARAAFSVESPQRWTVTAFVDNLTNERGTPVSILPTIPAWDVRLRPRTYGVQLEFKYR